MRRGEVWWAELQPRSGSEQRGRRPVVILSHDAFNTVEGWRSIIVVPVSSSERQAARGPTAVLLARGAGNLEQDSVALCHQLTTLDRAKFTQQLGLLAATDLGRVERGVRAALDLS